MVGWFGAARAKRNFTGALRAAPPVLRAGFPPPRARPSSTLVVDPDVSATQR